MQIALMAANANRSLYSQPTRWLSFYRVATTGRRAGEHTQQLQKSKKSHSHALHTSFAPTRVHSLDDITWQHQKRTRTNIKRLDLSQLRVAIEMKGRQKSPSNEHHKRGSPVPIEH